MLDQAHLPGAAGSGVSIVKQVAAWVVLGLVSLLVFSWYSGYRASQAVWEAEQNKPKPSEVASSAAAGKAPAKAPAQAPAKTDPAAQLAKVLVVSDVTLRKDPSTSSEAMRDLKKGEQLTLVGQVGPWYKVTDAAGKIGWVTASDTYTKVVGK